MADKVGGVEFEVDINTSGAVAAGSKLVQNNEKIEDSFQDVDLAARKSSNTMVKGSGKAGKALGGMSRRAGMAGVQVQQLVGQIQGGQSAFVALSQQAADLGIVLGAPLAGAVAGISAAFAGALVPSLFNSKSAMEELTTVSDTLNESLRKTDGGAMVLGNGIAELARKSESLARIKIAASIKDAEEQIRTSTAGISESIQDVAKVSLKQFNDAIYRSGLSFDDLEAKSYNTADAVDEIGAGGVAAIGEIETTVSSLSRRFGLTRGQALQLAAAISTFQNNKGAAGVKTLQSTLESLGDQTQNSNDKLNAFSSAMIPFFTAISDGVDATNLFRMALGDLDGALDDVGTNAGEELTRVGELTKTLTQELQLAELKLEGSTVQAMMLSAAFSAGLDNAEDLPAPIKELIKDLHAATEAQKAKNAAELQGIRDNAQAEREAEAAKKSRASAIEKIKQDIATESELRDRKFAADMEALRVSRENEEITKAEFDALELARVQAHAAQLIAIEQDTANKRADIEQKHNNTLSSFRNSAMRNAMALLDTFAGESKAAAIAAIAINKGLALAQNTQNTLVAQTRALAELGPIAGPPMAAKIGAYGSINAGLIAATGLAQAASVGKGGGSFSGGVAATNTTSNQPAQAQTPNQNISISGINADSLISGGQLVDTLNQALGDGYTINFSGG